ncbi:response regulator [Falsiroseomonas sp.]|uniref:response regulator n=1 Tax=Falsiroseomonas sp. TaxID=2870721 RepID=UPI003F70C832
MAGAGQGSADAARVAREDAALIVLLLGATPAALDTILEGLTWPEDVVLLLRPLPGQAAALLRPRACGAAPQLAEQGAPLLGGRILVLPAHVAFRILDGRLEAGEAPDPQGAPDALLASLAEALGPRGVAVQLAGALASAEGLATLRRAGGWVMAEAAQNGPPEDAIDQRVPLLAIGPALTAWARALRRGFGQEMLQAIHQPVALLDSGRQVLAANTAFEAAFGRAPERLEAALRGAPRLEALLAASASSTAGSAESIVEVPQGDGETRLLRVSACRVPGGESAARTLLAIEDLTEQTRLAGRLELAKAVAERADRDKSRFLAAASHDLRQPLQSMSMLHGLLAAKATDAGMLRLIGRLDETIDAMSGILDALLDINRMEVGRVHADIAPVPLGALFASLEREFADSARAAGLAWRMVPSDAVVLSDARLLRQVLRNLLSNALKYTRQGRILLGCRRAGGRLRIEVWDTGIGIPQGQMQAVFEEFHQIGKTARARSQGLGLGLAIARRLAKLLGHPIGVRSRENVGSCFHLDLPLAHGGAEAEDPAQGVPDAAAHILVIEDDPAVGDAVCMLLRQAGYTAVLAHDGSQAIALAADQAPALIITDYNLPGPFNGVELTLQLRQVLVPPPAAIILTGDTSARTRQEIGLLEVEHAPKPIRADDLLARVRRLLPVPVPVPVRPALPTPALHPARAAAAPDAMPDLPVPASADAGPAAAPPAKVRTGGQVFIVDDDAMLRRDVGEWLASNGWSVQSFPSAEAFLQADEPTRQGCVLVDAVMPGMDGLALLAALRPHAQRMPAIMVTGHGDVRMAVRAMTAGAIDFIEKPIGRADLLRSIATANARIANAMSEATARAEMAARLTRLTPRQREILDRVVAGSPSKIIAAELLLNQRTVENHRAAIMAKMGARSLPELIRKVVSASGAGG